MGNLTGKTLGKYRIIERLGRGGMAEVYKAFHPRLDRYVAIKVLHSHLAEGEDFLARFEREAKAVAALHHPNIVLIHDSDVEDGVYYMVMEFIEGGTLKRKMQELAEKGERMPLVEVGRIFRQIAEALAYAHERGMLHRDMKPANVLMETGGRVVLADFGIARILGDAQFTVTGALIGTPAYMSPEQGRGQTAAVASDMYSLGVILYEMVTGKIPFDADTPLAIIHKHIYDPLPMPRALRPEIPESLQRAILKALAKEPEDRFVSVVQMLEAVQNAISETVAETVPAAHPSVSAATEVESMPAAARESVVTEVPAPSAVSKPTETAAPRAAVEEAAPEARPRRRVKPLAIVLPTLGLAVVAGVIAIVGGGLKPLGEEKKVPLATTCGTLEQCIGVGEALRQSKDISGWALAFERAIGFVAEDKHLDNAWLWCELAAADLELSQGGKAEEHAHACLDWFGGNRDWIQRDYPQLVALLPPGGAGECANLETCLAQIQERWIVLDHEGLIPILDRATSMVAPENRAEYYWLWCDRATANVALERMDEARANLQACIDWAGGDRARVLKDYPNLGPMLGPQLPPPEERVLKIGVLGPFTGPAAVIGQEIQHAAIMAFEEINYTIGPYKIVLVFIDSQSDPDKAVQAYEEAIVRDGIQAGLLGWHSSVAIALMELTAKYRIPHFFSMGETDVVNEKWRSDPDKYGYWVKGWPAPRALVSKNYADAFGDLIAQGMWKPANRKIAIACEETDFGRAVGEPLAQLMTAAGWDVLGPDFFPVGEVEFHPLLGKYKASHVSVTVVTDTAVAGVGAFTKQAREIGLPGLLVMHGLGWVADWYGLTGAASDGVLDQIPQLAKPEALEWAKRYEERWGRKPSAGAGGLSYDWAKMFIRMLEATLKEHGELTSETIYAFARENLWTGTFTYRDGIIMPMYKFTPDTMPDPVVGKEAFIFPILQYRGGEGKIIWPLEWAQAKLEVP